MATRIIGKVAFRPRGTWNGNVTDYERLDTVVDSNVMYIALQDVPVGTPVSNTTYWQRCIDGFGGSAQLDTEMSDESVNGVQNKVIKEYVDEQKGRIDQLVNDVSNKVDKENGKVLSSNDYTDTDKALVGTIGDKVDKESGKGLSANDFTDTLKTKLDGIATGANKTTVDTALSSSSTNPVQNKVVNTALGGKVNASDPIVTSNIKFKDSKRTIEVIRLVANDENTNGEGVVIGAGGFTCIGGGESAKTIMDDTSIMTAPDVERMVIANDNYVDIYTNCNNGTDSAKHARFESNGNLTLAGSISATNITTMQTKLDAIGSYDEISPSADVATTHQTAKSVCSKKLPAGTYIVTGQIRWNSNATGVRIGGISTSADSTARDFMLGACPSSYTVHTITKLINLTKESTLYLNAYHNAGSGVTINVLASGTYLRWFKIA